MSGKAAEGPKPQKPLVLKKFKVVLAPEPKVEVSNAAGLTITPSAAATVPEDEGPMPRYESVTKRTGMFARATTTTAAAATAAPGKKVEKRTMTQAERLARPLTANDSDGESDSEEFYRIAEEAAPVPPPVSRPVAVPIIAAPAIAAPQPVATAKATVKALPPIAKQFLGMAVAAKKKSYAEAAVKRRMTDSIATTLIALEKQLGEMKISGLDIEKGIGLIEQAEKVDGKSKFLFDNELVLSDPLTDASLAELDDLFKSLRIRTNFIVGEGDVDPNSTSQLANDIDMLYTLISYAPKYLKDKPKIQERQRKQALKDMLSVENADTLIELETSLNEMAAKGVGVQDMKETPPTEAESPYVYEFENGNTFLPVDGSAEARKRAEDRLAELSPFFTGGTRFTLTKIIGFGPMNEEGTPLQTDLTVLQELFQYAKDLKGRVGTVVARQAVIQEEEEAKRAKTLAGTEYEALAKPIDAEMTKSPYEITTTSDYKPGTYKDKEGRDVALPKQQGFIPSTRRAFGYFIYDKYRRYMLKALEKLDPNACKALGDSSTATQIYEYQKFVRDYISFMTPYRGVLVYHGLGSGKTCTAIAASEALLSSGGKRRIIVMTPFSLRKNFIQQITFCGFRHYRLLNYWTPHPYKASDGKNALWLFATSVMKIPESYLSLAKGKTITIWIPDLTKPQSEQNYNTLGSKEQAEIRDQIYETLVYDPYKGKNGMIWFLNYNGITSSKLRDLACKVPSDAFDNSVIVVDEIHNLVRLMQGVIDPYLKKMYMGEVEAETKRDHKYLDTDRITSSKWRPKLCGKSMNYKRGYLFYRLLVEAKNTKIVGLSGTPLINFPEELGILANILHGYNFIYTASIPKVSEVNGNETIRANLKKMAEGNDKTNFCPDIDFYDVTIQTTQPTIDFTFTFLPEGYRKVQGQLGVERIPFTETLETTEQKLAKARACITTVLKGINPAYSFTLKIVEKAEPLLPVMGEPSIPEAKNLDDSFKGRFVDADGVSIVNAQILMKRLSGLISYYKGSRKDLMPEVKKEDDVVVKVPMSLDQQKKYIEIRLAEIKIESEKEKRGKGAEVKGDDAELKKLSSSQNYRMASRQACNFIFPDGFTRPRPMTRKQAKEADEFGGSMDDLVGEDQAPEESALVRSKKEEAEEKARDEREAAEAKDDDERVSMQEEEEEVKAKRKEMADAGSSAGEIEAAVVAIRERFQEERQGGLLLAEQLTDVSEETSEELSEEQKKCLANMLPGETYQAALIRAKNCLLTLGLPKLALKDPQNPTTSPLGRWSPKYKAILENMAAIYGSALVYSQFLGMEGIGVFTIAMQANQYDPIRIVSRDGEFMFDEKTEASIRKGPGSPSAPNNRFILFTGGEGEEIRKINIDIFNAKFSELPTKINTVLRESGFTDDVGNKHGELCKVFCITAAGAEGLSLKNVRSVHIMEPYWNDVRMAQVKGRAVRICSHQDLPLKERNVKIYTYVSVFSREAQQAKGDPREGDRMKWAIPQEIWNRDSITKAIAETYGLTVSANKSEYAMTSDERLYYISEKKKKLVENLVILMKTAAADCLLNYKENMDGTFVCRLLGNEGDFMYHPNLQKDIELNKNDDIGDIFVVPQAQLAEVKAAQAKLVFEGEEETAAAATTTVATAKPPTTTTTVATTTTATKPTTIQRVKYAVKISGKDYFVSAMPTLGDDGGLTVDKFTVYDKADTAFAVPKGEAKAEFKAGVWKPVAGTVKMFPTQSK